MTRIIRWNPNREMMILRNAMDRLVDSDFYSPIVGRALPSNWGLALDVAETEDEFLVKASLPGINVEDVDVTYDSNVLTIKAEIKEEREEGDEERRYHMRERRYGSFCRSLSLPSTIDADAIEASYDAGVLTLNLPKVEEAKPKRIAVKSVESSKMIEG